MISLGGFPVLEGQIELVRVGVWVADLEVACELEKLDPKPTLDLGGGTTLASCVVASGTFGGRVRVRVVGGAGGMGRAVLAKDYRVTPARVPLADTLAEGGERLSGDASPKSVDVFLSSWTRTAGTVGSGVAELAAKLGAAWRILPDGSTWIGEETWPESRAKGIHVLDDDLSRGRLTLRADEPSILPGTAVLGRRMGRVVVRVAPADTTIEAWVEPAQGSAGAASLLDGLSRLVTRIMARVDYHALYASKVLAQNGDGSLDVLPDDARIPSKTRVPIRSFPGTTIRVARGARVLLGFENGDASKPIALQWEPAGLESIEIGGARPVARLGDQVIVTIAGPVPITGSVLIAGTPSPLLPGAMVMIPTPLTGSIITASETLKSG